MQVAKSMYWPRLNKVSVFKKIELLTVIKVCMGQIFKSPKLIQKNGVEFKYWEEARHRHIDHFKIM